MRSISGLVTAVVVWSTTLLANAAPILSDPSYSVEPLATGVGAVTGMDVHPVTGDLYLADYQSGRILKVAAPLGPGIQPFGVERGRWGRSFIVI